MSSTIPRFVAVRRVRSRGSIGQAPREVVAPQNKMRIKSAASCGLAPFGTSCVFRDCIFHNHNHLYNLARYDIPTYKIEEEAIHVPEAMPEAPKPKPKRPPKVVAAEPVQVADASKPPEEIVEFYQ